MFKQLILTIDRIFRKNDIPYMIIGGQAVLLYGEPRFTRDIDISVGSNSDSLDKIVDILLPVPLEPLPSDWHEFVGRTMVLPLLHRESDIRVDIIFSQSPYQQEAMGRVVPVQMEGSKINYISPEDLVVFKVSSGRPRDMEDARLVLIKQNDLDQEYIRRKLTELSLEDRDLLSEFSRLSTKE